MSDSLVSRKEHGHHAPLRCGFNKDFNDLLNGFSATGSICRKKRTLLPRTNRK